jgi:hypothetical protein
LKKIGSLSNFMMITLKQRRSRSKLEKYRATTGYKLEFEGKFIEGLYRR